MARKTKAQLAAEEVDETPTDIEEEVDALLNAGYEAGEADADDPNEEFDLSGVMEAEAVGDYEAFKDKVVIECIKLESLKGNDSGNKYIKLTWQVTEGPHAKAHIWDTIMLEGKGLGFAKRKLNQLGLSASTLKRTDIVGAVYEATTKIKRGGEQYDDSTIIAKYGARVSGSGGVAVTSEEALP